jgi:hypothetical protein
MHDTPPDFKKFLSIKLNKSKTGHLIPIRRAVPQKCISKIDHLAEWGD